MDEQLHQNHSFEKYFSPLLSALALVNLLQASVFIQFAHVKAECKILSGEEGSANPLKRKKSL